MSTISRALSASVKSCLFSWTARPRALVQLSDTRWSSAVNVVLKLIYTRTRLFYIQMEWARESEFLSRWKQMFLLADCWSRTSLLVWDKANHRQKAQVVLPWNTMAAGLVIGGIMAEHSRRKSSRRMNASSFIVSCRGIFLEKIDWQGRSARNKGMKSDRKYFQWLSPSSRISACSTSPTKNFS